MFCLQISRKVLLIGEIEGRIAIFLAYQRYIFIKLLCQVIVYECFPKCLDTINMENAPYKISGHETFPCRYSWLPKVIQGIQKDPNLFKNEDQAMVTFGVGKNMVRAIRFWGESFGIIDTKKKSGSFLVSPFGEAIFGKKGFDPFFQDIRTLWLLHWGLSANNDRPLLAWNFLLNKWHEPEWTKTKILTVLDQELSKNGADISQNTIEHHLDVFIHTYVPTRSRGGEPQEDTLDCPFVDLNFIEKVGERTESLGGRREPIYSFNRSPKTEITSQMFAYCLNDFFTKNHPNEQSLSFTEICVGPCSPGQIFKLSETDIREYLLRIQKQTGAFAFKESAALQHVFLSKKLNPLELLGRVYNN